MSTQTQTTSKETALVICWLNDEKDSLHCYYSLNEKELKDLFSDYMINTLRPQSIADAALALINIALEERVDWVAIKDWLERKQKSNEFEQWLTENYTIAGKGYYLSTNSTDFKHYEINQLIQLFNSQYNSNVKDRIIFA